MDDLDLNAEVRDLLRAFAAGAEGILRDRLVAIYLYGSLITGDFDLDASDVDLLTVTREHLSPGEFLQLDELHGRLADAFSYWKGRLEVAYVSLEALRTFRERRSTIAVISPGEPFHEKDAGSDWLINWYTIREQGVALQGPSAEQVIPEIGQPEFLDRVRAQALEWREWVEHADTRPYQGYVILTMCRALHVIETGAQVSKIAAASWAQKRLPEEAELIQRALHWRKAHRDYVEDSQATFPETKRFVLKIADFIESA
jgi:predicted nucleotidyltransferase